MNISKYERHVFKVGDVIVEKDVSYPSEAGNNPCLHELIQIDSTGVWAKNLDFPVIDRLRICNTEDEIGILYDLYDKEAIEQARLEALKGVKVWVDGTPIELTKEQQNYLQETLALWSNKKALLEIKYPDTAMEEVRNNPFLPFTTTNLRRLVELFKEICSIMHDTHAHRPLSLSTDYGRYLRSWYSDYVMLIVYLRQRKPEGEQSER